MGTIRVEMKRKQEVESGKQKVESDATQNGDSPLSTRLLIVTVPRGATATLFPGTQRQRLLAEGTHTVEL